MVLGEREQLLLVGRGGFCVVLGEVNRLRLGGKKRIRQGFGVEVDLYCGGCLDESSFLGLQGSGRVSGRKLSWRRKRWKTYLLSPDVVVRPCHPSPTLPFDQVWC